MNVFFFGMGYSARAAAAALRERYGADLAVTGTTRGEEKAHLLGQQGIKTHLFDGSAPGPDIASALDAATHVIVSIAPKQSGDPVLAHYADRLLAAPRLEWVGYYSTVGVYGDFGGAWIDEDAILSPSSERGRWRVDAETSWRDLARRKGVPLTILRLAGIYGPGRSAFDKLAAGTARRVIKQDQVFNRIHVADIGRVTALAAERKLSGTFNLADDAPCPPQDVITHAAELIGVAPPAEVPFDQADMSAMARSFYADNKRVSNARIKAALGVDLVYPTYREGLAAILAAQNGEPA